MSNKKSAQEISENNDELSFEATIDLINKQISPLCVLDSYEKNFKKLYKKYSSKVICDAIEKGVDTYLEYDDNGKLTEDSVNLFLNKLGGIIVMSNKSPIEVKMHYIKGICRNRFNYWDDRKGLAIIKSYVDTLKEYGYTNDEIIADLDGQASELAKTARNWSEWRNTMDAWMEQIEASKDEVVDNHQTDELNVEDIERIAERMVNEIDTFIEGVKYISKLFDCDENKLYLDILQEIDNYVSLQIGELKADSQDLEKFKPTYDFCKDMLLINWNKPVDTKCKFTIDKMYTLYVERWITETLYLTVNDITNKKDAILFEQYFNKSFSKLLKSIVKNNKK